jgi:hypothetical protein
MALAVDIRGWTGPESADEGYQQSSVIYLQRGDLEPVQAWDSFVQRSRILLIQGESETCDVSPGVLVLHISPESICSG